jgi:virginiamycin B lyase
MKTRTIAATLAVASLLTACTTSSSGSPSSSGFPPSQESATPMGSTGSATTSPAGDGTSVYALDDRLQAELAIEGEPDMLTTGYGAIWVGIPDQGEAELAGVGRIDPATNELAATVQVGRKICGGLAARFGSIWTASCAEQKLYRISPETNEVEATIDVPVFPSVLGAPPLGGFATGAGAVWMVTSEGGGSDFDVLVRVDPRTNEITDEIPLGHQGGSVGVGGDAAWVTAPEDGMLLRVDPKERAVIVEIPGFAQPVRVVAGEGGVWVLSGTWPDHVEGADGAVTKVDPTTNEIVATIPIDEQAGQAGDLQFGEGSVWVRTQYTLLAEIDPATNAIVSRYEDQKAMGSIATGFGSVWLSDAVYARVWRVPLD